MSRSFTIVRSEIKLPENATSRYESDSPYTAASKAGRRLFSEAKKQRSKKSEIRFTLKETTMGSKGKEFTYVATKRKLTNPKVVSLGSTTVTYEYAYEVKSCMKR